MKFKLRTQFVVVTVIALLLGLWLNWDAIPGTFYKTPNGIPRGTGTTEYKYDDGSLMLREWYYRGLPYKSTWFKPDGSELATELFDKKSGGIGYYLRQNGTIKSKHAYEYEYDHDFGFGMYYSVGATYYDKQGNPVPDATEPIN